MVHADMKTSFMGMRSIHLHGASGSEESHVRGLMLCRLHLEILHDFTLTLRFVSEVQ